jgi:hypothetical protein
MQLKYNFTMCHTNRWQMKDRIPTLTTLMEAFFFPKQLEEGEIIWYFKGGYWAGQHFPEPYERKNGSAVI